MQYGSLEVFHENPLKLDIKKKVYEILYILLRRNYKKLNSLETIIITANQESPRKIFCG